MDGLHRCIDDAVAQGCRVFIAGSANAAEFRRYSGAVLIELKLRSIDYAVAICKAFQSGKRPAVVSYCWSEVVSPDELSVLFDKPIEYITYQSDEDLVEKLEGSDAEVVIGASRANEAAQQMGKDCIFIYPGAEQIDEALRRARSVVQALQKEQRDNELIHAIISESRTGIVGFSVNRDILVMNEAALQFTGLTAEQLRRTALRQFLPDEDFRRRLEEDSRQGFLVTHTGPQVLRMQLTRLEKDGQNLGALLLIDGASESEMRPDKPQLHPFLALPTFKDTICLSAPMKKSVSLAKLYGGKADAPLVITGEHGVGKELLAQCIHSFFHGGAGGYVSVNCAAVLDSEAARFFYGPHDEDGRSDHGIVDLRHVGTLVLENLWEADDRLQSCILWAVKGMVDCVTGSSGDPPLRFGVISIIPDDMWERCRSQVRPDLLRLLDTFTLTVPPLRERQADIEPLFSLWLRNDPCFSRAGSRTVASLKPLLTDYSWPGNVAELQIVCRRYALEASVAGKSTPAGKHRLLIACIGEEKIFDDILSQQKASAPFDSLSAEALGALVTQFKSLLLYSNEQIAERLGLSRTGIWRKLNL
ncbi:MAG: PrpR N-terminal domain-containing protein [Oscillospiraceae bacterium]